MSFLSLSLLFVSIVVCKTLMSGSWRQTLYPKVLQQLGWLYNQDRSSFQNHNIAILFRCTSHRPPRGVEAKQQHLVSVVRVFFLWLFSCTEDVCCRSVRCSKLVSSWLCLYGWSNYNKANEPYQQAVNQDGHNPTFWCSIGVLYFQISQYRNALDAYSRAICINLYISEVWFDLESLYESCNNQITDAIDAIDAYACTAELNPSNVAIAQHLTSQWWPIVGATGRPWRSVLTTCTI